MQQRVVRFDLSYDGTDFHGWAAQRDPSVRTIEGEVTRVLTSVTGQSVRLSVAGRTDAGVHAEGQVAAFRTGSDVAPDKLQAAVNGEFGGEIAVTHAVYAPDGFDARLSASARGYRYRIRVAEVPDPLSSRWVWHRPGSLTLTPMRTAAAHLVGEHDFTSFCRHPGADRSTTRDVQRLSIAAETDEVVIRVRANAFLHQMVRAVVGVLAAVGDGRMDPDRVAAILAARDRQAAGGRLAPARGLTLERVWYGRRAAR